MTKLTVLSFGGGQDSTAILLKFIEDYVELKKYVSDDFLVLMSDTGDEHDHTYDHVEAIRDLCSLNSMEFVFLTKDMGYHKPSWPDLITPQLRDPGGEFTPTLVQTGKKSCTDNLKITPFYKYLDSYVNCKYFGSKFKTYPDGGCKKLALKAFFNTYGFINVLLGFAAGEDKRFNKSVKLEEKQRIAYLESLRLGKPGSWWHIIKRKYPLRDWGMNRFKCIEYIESQLPYEVMPSNCVRCPYQSPIELLWVYRNEPEKWRQWVLAERKKIDRYDHHPDFKNSVESVKNHGVYNSKKLLPEKLNDAIQKFGHLSDEDLHQYKKTHGCQTNTF